MALPQYTKAVEKNRASEAVTLLKSIGDAKEVYFRSTGSFPSTFADLDLSFTSSNGSTATGSSFETKHFTYYLNDSYSCDYSGNNSGNPVAAEPKVISISYCIAPQKAYYVRILLGLEILLREQIVSVLVFQGKQMVIGVPIVYRPSVGRCDLRYIYNSPEFLARGVAF